ncbi:MAG: SGNH/GDSL hydrolase family protein [Streptosporangiales bacterium]|nr:SGNH/GDSL hydrolase family protein [Streptosporangiales bacterium]
MRSRTRWAALLVTLLAMFGSLVGCSGSLTAIEASGRASSQQAAASQPGIGEPQAVSARKSAFTPNGPVVALGDSYTAGLLLPLDSSAKPVGCFRSTVNYASRVADALHAKQYANAACQSAGVVSLNHAAQTADGINPPQLNSLAADDSLVMMSLGGDDLNFSHVLKGCMNPFGRPCQDHYWYLNQQISAEKPKMIAALNEIHRKAPHARVLLLGYPDLFPASGGCWPIAPFSTTSIAFLRSSELKLNAMLAQAASATGTAYVDTYGATTGHDMCQGSQVKDVEGLIPSSTAMSFHPNARGQAAMADQVLATLGYR